MQLIKQFLMSVIYFSLNTQGLDNNTTGLGITISTLACPFHEDSCINASAQVVNVHVHVLSRVRALTILARAFVHESS